MPFTSIYGWPVPDPNAPPDTASDIRDLADDIEEDVNRLETVDIAGLQSQLNALEASAVVVLDAVAEDTPASAIEFTNIDQSYDHLLCYWRGDGESGTGYASLNLRFNGDSGTNDYSSQRVHFATAVSNNWVQQLEFGGGPLFTVMRVGLAGGAAGGSGSFYVPFYSQPAFTKSAVGQSVAHRQIGGNIYPAMATAGGRWVAHNDPITSIWLSPSGNGWDRIRAHLVGIRSGT